MKPRKTRTGHAKGLDAERMAAFYLRLKFYRIMAVRFKTPVGEIDLIARRGNTIAFVEVKTRATQTAALEAVLPQAQARIRRAAEWWLAKNQPRDNSVLRFDVIALHPYSWIRHIKNAF